MSGISRQILLFVAGIVFAGLILPLSCGSVHSPEFAEDFSPERGRMLVEALAHDSLQGRNTPSPGLDGAARLIAREFDAAGLKALRPGFLHPYELERLHLDTNSGMHIQFKGSKSELHLKDDFIPYAFSAAAALNGLPVVFAGYGIDDSTRNYNDYDGIDVTGAAVMIMRGEPSMSDADSPFDGLRLTTAAQLQTKVRTARERGAAAVLLVNGPRQSASLKPRGFDWPVLYPDAGLKQLPYRPAFKSERLIPVVHVGERCVKLLLNNADSLTALQQLIDSTRQPHSMTIENAAVDLDVRLRTEIAIANNVVGVLPGRNDLASVVVGAHYDHVGVYYFGRTDLDAVDTGEETILDSICNGADDNASGTAALILCARSLASIPTPPKRTIYFVAFSGEERGLYGSEAFVRADTLFKRETCTAMLNMDMVGRNAIDSLHLGGGDRSPQLRDMCLSSNDAMQAKFVLSEDIETFYKRSDQWNFARYGIPSLFFFSGIHEDYHRPGDEAHKLNYDKLARAAELCARTTWQTANAQEAPAYVLQGDETEPQ